MRFLESVPFNDLPAYPCVTTKCPQWNGSVLFQLYVINAFITCILEHQHIFELCHCLQSPVKFWFTLIVLQISSGVLYREEHSLAIMCLTEPYQSLPFTQIVKILGCLLSFLKGKYCSSLVCDSKFGSCDFLEEKQFYLEQIMGQLELLVNLVIILMETVLQKLENNMVFYNEYY